MTERQKKGGFLPAGIPLPVLTNGAAEYFMPKNRHMTGPDQVKKRFFIHPGDNIAFPDIFVHTIPLAVPNH